MTVENITVIAKKAEQLQYQSSDNSTLQQQLKSIEKKIENITSAIEDGGYSQALSQRLQALETERQDIEIQIASVPSKKKLTAKNIQDYLLKYTNGDITDEAFQKKLTKAFIEQIILTRECAVVTFRINDFIFDKTFVF